MMGRIIKVILVLLCWLVASPAGAVAPTNFVWDRNTEIDMDHYNVFTCSTSATCVPNLNIGTVLQPALGASPSFPIPAAEGRAAVTAVDLVGNESGLSNIVPFDRLAPSAPANARTQ